MKPDPSKAASSKPSPAAANAAGASFAALMQRLDYLEPSDVDRLLSVVHRLAAV